MNTSLETLYAEARHVLDKAAPKPRALPTATTSQVEPERLLTAKEVADLLGVHQNYVYDQAGKGLIPSYKFGGHRRFRWSEVENWLRKSYVEPQ